VASSDRTPLMAALGGLAAGAAGTGTMTVAQTVYSKATGGGSSSTPAQVGKRIIEGVLKREVPEERMEQLNNVMHWAYGTSWGALYGIAAGSRRPSPLRGGLLFALGVWGASLVELPAMGLAPPVWEYEPKDLAPDLGFHLVYGVAVATAFKIVENLAQVGDRRIGSLSATE
jgi:hypothetical protein